MSKNLTINLLSGYQENEDALFAVNLAEAALSKGYGVKIFLYGNGCNLANQEHPVQGASHMNARLQAHMDIGKIGPRLEKIAAMGAEIATCHTTEYGRGTEGDAYRVGIKWGDVGQSFTKFLLTSDVLLTFGH
ncbi:MAG: DsrE family protein [Chloroflexi bacterium]|nr:DsrE family protein [Chloroflexota bacterium]